MRSQTLWEPESGKLSLGVSIFSYAGEVILGVVSEAWSVDRPRELLVEFERAFSTLVDAV